MKPRSLIIQGNTILRGNVLSVNAKRGEYVFWRTADQLKRRRSASHFRRRVMRGLEGSAERRRQKTSPPLFATLTVRCIIVILLALVLPGTLSAAKATSYTWKPISDGIAYAVFSFPPSPDDEMTTTIHAFRIDPAKVRIDTVAAKDERQGTTAAEMARREGALIVINGGFFTPDHTTIGLLMKNGHTLSRLHHTSWWSVFAMTEDTPAILSPKDAAKATTLRMAIQAGPRLAVNGKIPRLKESVAARSAVGITPDGRVIIAITQGPGISMTELARRMSMGQVMGGLGCPDAMALDGGSSSQLLAKTRRFELSLPNIARVTNGLAVFAK